jgi:hypothetical protein
MGISTTLVRAAIAETLKQDPIFFKVYIYTVELSGRELAHGARVALARGIS